MDQLALQSTFAKVRNPYGLRRWAYMRSTDNPSIDFRIAQLFGVFGQPYGENNAPLLTARILNGETLYHLVSARDQWTRPARRWFKATLTTVGTDRFVFVTSGTPFLAEDPFQPVEYRASPGDDIFLDDGAGTVSEAKIAAIDPTGFASGNAVRITSKAGAALPADGVYYIRHTLDAFFIQMTVSYMIPQSQFPALDPTVHADPFQAKLRFEYYDNDGSTVVESYERSPIKELSTIAADVPFAFIEVLGDRFGVAASPVTPYYQIFEVFEVHLARVPDKVEVAFDNTGPISGPVVDLGNVGVYYGSTVPAGAAVPPNILPPNPNPAPTTRYNLYPPPDPEDFWTGSGDIVIMPVGTLCPAGFEDIGQVLSRANSHYVVDTATGRPLTFQQLGPNPLTMSLTAEGNTRFTGNLPATAEDPSHPGVPLRGGQNNTATWEIVFMPSNVNPAFRQDQVLTFRIPELRIEASGNFAFEIPGDIRNLVGTTSPPIDSRLFISGIIRADSLANAGTYDKPVQDGADATPVDSDTAPFPPIANELHVPLEDAEDPILVSVGDLIVFVDESGNPVAEIDTGGAVFTGPDFRVTAINADEGTITVVDRQTDDGVGGRTTEVWRFVGDTSNPSVPQPNFYRVFSANTAHTHFIGTSDAESKSRKDDGSFVTSQDHTHKMNAEAIIVPYTSMKFCVKL